MKRFLPLAVHSPRVLLIPVVLVWFCPSGTARAYIDAGGEKITLPEILLEFHAIAVARVDRSKGKAIIYKVAEVLKGKAGTIPLKHQVAFEGQPPAAIRNLKPGQTAVVFSETADQYTLTYLDGLWYLTKADKDGWWSGPVRQDFLRVYAGPVGELGPDIQKLLRGQTATARFQARDGGARFAQYSLRDPHRKPLARDPKLPAPQTRPLDAWAKDLQAKQPAVRLEAALALVALGNKAKPEVPALLKALHDDQIDVRWAAATALGRTGFVGKDAVTALAAALKDPDWFVCVAAAESLAHLGPKAKDAVPALRTALAPTEDLRDWRPLRSAAVAVALVKIDPRSEVSKNAVVLLVDRLLNDDRPGTYGARAAGARALGECGGAARSAAPALERRLQDEDGDVRIAAAKALMDIAPKEYAERAVKVLSTALSSPVILERVLAADALAGIGPAARAAESALKKLATAPEPELRRAAANALKAIERK